MKIYTLLLLILFSISGEVLANERYILKFELPLAENKIEKGMAIVSSKPFTWSHGLQRSYLSLKCEMQKSGKLRKRYITEEYFTGLMITHKLIDEEIEIVVTYRTGVPRLKEIRALAPEDCKEITPLIHKIQESYRFPATHGLTKVLPFGAGMKLHIKLQIMGRAKAG